MPYLSSRMSAALMLALLSAGCRLPGRDGPVPQSLTNCRRLSQQGVAALERGEQPKAETLLAQAVAACPVDGEARRHYAESLWHRGAQSEAIIQMEEASRQAGDDAVLWARLAEMRMAVGQTQAAHQDAERALKIDPKSPAAWASRGGVMRRTGRPDEALANYLRALAYAPSDRTVLWEIAELHRQLNRPQQALQSLQMLADTYSRGQEPAIVLCAMGQAYVAIGRYDDGVENLSLAVTRGNPDAAVLCQLAEAQLLAGRPAETADTARRASTLEPQHASSNSGSTR